MNEQGRERHRRGDLSNVRRGGAEASCWTIITVGIVCALLAQVPQDNIRIDTFDKNSNRTGYIVINPNTGRIDQYDARSNRLGYGTTTTTPYGTRIDTFTNNGTRTNNGTLSTTPRR